MFAFFCWENWRSITSRMAILRGQFYGQSLALLIWLQNFERCISGEYNIDLSEMEFLASNLSPRECYDFYNQLSHRGADRGGVSIYAQKEKSHQLPCRSLLVTWLTDPEESAFRSHENIELKLRKVGRKDLARWVVGRIESSLQRKRRLNDREESTRTDAIVVDRVGEKIAPIVEDREAVIKGEDIAVDDRNNSCIFWKIFFSVIVVLCLVVLFGCFYRFLYTKLRCIYRRLDYSEDRECRPPEQTYGTASEANLSEKSIRKSCDFLRRTANNRGAVDGIESDSGDASFESPEFFTSASESNEDIFASRRFFSRSEKTKPIKSEETFIPSFSDESPRWISCSCNEISETREKNSPTQNNISRIKLNNSESERQFPPSMKISTAQKLDTSESLKIFPTPRKMSSILMPENPSQKNLPSRKKIPEIENRFPTPEKSSKNSFTEKSEVLELQENSPGSRKKFDRSEVENSLELGENSRRESTKKIDENSRVENSSEIYDCSGNPSEDGETDVAETYDELAMLFSEEMKRQWRPCRRSGCRLARNLRSSGRPQEHDVRKCRARFGPNFGYRRIGADERPTCSSAEICPDTYDEFELMRATREERENVARAIVERRKRFLDQPCLSPAKI